MEYVTARTSGEVLRTLEEAGGRGVVLAGGTDLMVDMKAGKLKPEVLVDITRVEQLRGIAVEGDRLTIGAAVTLTEVARSPLIGKYYPSLAKGCGCVGSLQIRNSATLAGNVVSAQPAGDGAMALAPLDPVFTILTREGEVHWSMGEMYAGFAKSRVDHSAMLVTKISIPLPGPGPAATFDRLELRKSLSLPMLTCAAMVQCSGGEVDWARITVGPVRATAAEAYLSGKELDAGTMAQAGRLALENANPRSNPLRGSREYRLETLPVLIRRALEGCRDQLT